MFSGEEFAGIGDVDRVESSGSLGTGLSISHGLNRVRRSNSTQHNGVESFWQSVLAFEKAPHTTHFDQLLHKGVDLVEPASLKDDAVSDKLWEVIQTLASLRVFLRHTDHLSDRDLYELLWWDILRQETVDTSKLPGTTCQLDVLGQRSEEQRYTYLKYYADEQERRFYSEQYPDDEVPIHQEPPFQRDAILPRH